jgi:hypothetical protein
MWVKGSVSMRLQIVRVSGMKKKVRAACVFARDAGHALDFLGCEDLKDGRCVLLREQVP